MNTIEERAYEWSLEEARAEGYDFASLKEGYIKGAKEQKRIDIEGRFGTLDHIQNVLQSIVNSAEHITSGNVAHNKASIKLLASGLLGFINEIK